MGIRATRPTTGHLVSIADGSTADPVTYSPVGVTSSGAIEPGYRRERWACQLGRGRDVFERAVDGLRQWAMHERSGLIVANPGPVEAGVIVAMAAPLPVGFVEVVCRVVAVVDEPDRFGFAYGTLSRHPEQGEESFTVSLASDDQVEFTIVAVSRARHPLARALPPVARFLQQRATLRYLQSMKSIADADRHAS